MAIPPKTSHSVIKYSGIQKRYRIHICQTKQEIKQEVMWK